MTNSGAKFSRRSPPTSFAPIATLRGVLAAATVAIADGAEVQQVLWAVWSATDWSSRLARTARGSGTASRAANRDLDSVLALFRAAARADEAFGIARPVDAFLRISSPNPSTPLHEATRVRRMQMMRLRC